jgi:adenosylhomocysteine nucleosidase
MHRAAAVFLLLVTLVTSSAYAQERAQIVVLVSANAEWRPTKEALKPATISRSPYGEYFTHLIAGEPVLFFHGGRGKIAAAGSTQYVVSRWQPDLLINLGTCGGIEGRIERGEVLLVTRTVTYDIKEAMGDSADAIRAYSTDIDLSWIDNAIPVKARRSLLVSADRDLVPSETADLVRNYGAIAADWESSAIAHVAKLHSVRLLILRGVSDLVGPRGGEALGNLQLFQTQAAVIMRSLLQDLTQFVPYLVPRLNAGRQK